MRLTTPQARQTVGMALTICGWVLLTCAAAMAQPADSPLPELELELARLPRDVQQYAKTESTAVERYLLLREELQSQYALAQQARQREEQTEIDFWVDQIRTTARSARQSPVPGADALGEYWLLQADMFSARHRTMGLDAQQRETIARLDQFITKLAADDYPTSETRTALLKQTRLVLLGLYDHRGQSKQAKSLYAQLLTDHAELTDALVDSFGHLARIGQPVSLDITTDNGQDWSLGKQLGQVVVVHFWSDWFEPSVRVFDALHAMHERYRDRRMTILSINVLPQDIRHAAQIAWPTARMQQDQLDNLHRLGVWTTPRLMLIDAQGHLAAIGSTTAVLEQVGPLVVDAHANARQP